jgi:RimJ/RimL family protein N-acetyltransferase
VWVLVENYGARKFYERMGFSADGTLKSDDRDDFVAKQMRYCIRKLGQADRSPPFLER